MNLMKVPIYRNPAGSKLVRRAAKHHFGSRKTFAEALNWYTNLRGLRL